MRESNHLLITTENLSVLLDVGESLLAEMQRCSHPKQLALDTNDRWIGVNGDLPDEVSLGRVVNLSHIENQQDVPLELGIKILDARSLGLLPVIRFNKASPQGTFEFAHQMDLWPVSRNLFDLFESNEFDVSGIPFQSLGMKMKQEIRQIATEKRQHFESMKVTDESDTDS